MRILDRILIIIFFLFSSSNSSLSNELNYLMNKKEGEENILMSLLLSFKNMSYNKLISILKYH